MPSLYCDVVVYLVEALAFVLCYGFLQVFSGVVGLIDHLDNVTLDYRIDGCLFISPELVFGQSEH